MSHLKRGPALGAWGESDASSGVASEAKFQTLLETASVAIVAVNEDGRIEWVNAKAEGLFGYQREELIGQALEILLPERFRKLHVHHRANYFSSPRVRSMGAGMDLAGQRKDGAEFPLEIGLSYLETEEGLLTVSFISDITARKRSQEALKRTALRLQSMREIDRAILAARSPQEIARVALHHLQQLLPCQRSCVMLFDFTANRTLMLASLVRDGSENCCQTQPPSTFAHLATLREQRCHLETDLQLLGREAHHLGQEVMPYLDVPLVSSGDLIGILRLTAATPAAFTFEQVEIAREVANHLAIALQEAQLREALQQHATKLEARVMERTQEIERRRRVAEGLREILTALNSNRPFSEILDYIVALGGRLLKTDAAALFQTDESGSFLRIVAARGLSADYVANTQIPIGLGVVGQAVKERRPMAISDLLAFLQQDRSEEQEIEAVWRELAQVYRSLLAVPLMVKEEVYGGIVLYYTAPRIFSSEEIGLAATFGDQVALAIENARLRAQVKESAVAAERNRLARDLHDAVTQTLFSASLIAEVLPQLFERKPEEGTRRLQELRQLTRGALAEMRTLLFELRPAVLVKSDLRDLLRQLAEATTGRSRVPVSVTYSGTPMTLPPDVQVAFYRIAQEALNNVAKHSAASMAVLTLRFLEKEDALFLSVYDNGRGFDPAEVAPQRLGLSIMQERAEAISATLTIDSEPSYGTEVMVNWCKKEKYLPHGVGSLD
ncbi:MAG: GAF domain-containing protein [Ardenticatenaceae bacterium]